MSINPVLMDTLLHTTRLICARPIIGGVTASVAALCVVGWQRRQWKHWERDFSDTEPTYTCLSDDTCGSHSIALVEARARLNIHGGR